ncbi:MAG: dCMP deaminase, partial [Candidatus Omnitrophica bacterium]|nr:dCMP deaminase [Candidatus Omnitrophota bacterium]
MARTTKPQKTTVNIHRPNWDQYFLKLAMLASERATCPRMHCGCVLVKNKNVIS